MTVVQLGVNLLRISLLAHMHISPTHAHIPPTHPTSPTIHSYMRQVLDEALRMSTLGPYAARYSDKDISVDGYSVPAGTPIIQALGVALKNETQWEDVHK